jgi:hypothetical protein
MTGSLVHVWTDVGGRKPAALLAKIIEKDGVILTIRYLSESDDHIWRYETDTYEIDDDSVAEYLKTDSELELGFIAHGDDGFIKVDSDEDYVPSDEDESESYEESDEEEDEEDFEEDEESDAESEESNVDED